MQDSDKPRGHERERDPHPRWSLRVEIWGLAWNLWVSVEDSDKQRGDEGERDPHQRPRLRVGIRGLQGYLADKKQHPLLGQL